MNPGEHTMDLPEPHSACADTAALAAKLEQQIRYLLNQFDPKSPSEKFSPTEWLVLLALDQNQGLELKQLADAIRIGVGSTARATRSLAALRLIEWRKDPSNRRQYTMSLTKAGRSVCAMGKLEKKASAQAWFQNIGMEELAAITSILGKCMPPDEGL